MDKFIQGVIGIVVLLIIADDLRRDGIFPEEFYCQVKAGKMVGNTCNHDSILAALVNKRERYPFTWGAFN